MKNIPEVDYLKIIETMPIVCVDVIIRELGSIILVKRNDEPAKDQWWFPGGRLYKGESLSDCAIRKSKEELNLNCNIVKFVCCAETIFPTGVNNIPTHSINFVYLLEMTGKNLIHLDKHSSDWIFVDDIKINYLNQKN